MSWSLHLITSTSQAPAGQHLKLDMHWVVLLSATLALTQGTDVPAGGLVYGNPYGGYTAQQCNEEGLRFVDEKNMCWFHTCVRGENGAFYLQPQACALGSKVSYNFVSGFSNPCTVNFDTAYGYECKREKESVNGEPACAKSTVCQNGGTATYEADKCWCICPASWQGEYDCSLPTRINDLSHLPPASNICVNGVPLDDWCAKKGGCLNGGTCFNQCDDFWCLCPDREHHNYLGKRCEL